MSSPAAKAPDRAPVLSVDLDGLSFDGRPVLGAIAMDLMRGETLALTGPSGIGKTTLLRVLAGLETAYAGKVRVPGRVAMVFQEPTLLPWRSAVQNLCLTTGISVSAAEAALADVGLAGLGARFPGQLSLGQQRRLSLARAFAASPDVLFLDEPFVSLDPRLADEMMDLFVSMREAQGVATILVTHVEAEARRLANRVVRLGGSPAVIVEGAT